MEDFDIPSTDPPDSSWSSHTCSSQRSTSCRLHMPCTWSLRCPSTCWSGIAYIVTCHHHIWVYIHNNMDTLRLHHTSYYFDLYALQRKSDTNHNHHSTLNRYIPCTNPAGTHPSVPRRAKRTTSESTRTEAACHTHDTRLYQEFNNMYYGNKFFLISRPSSRRRGTRLCKNTVRRLSLRLLKC